MGETPASPDAAEAADGWGCDQLTYFAVFSELPLLEYSPVAADTELDQGYRQESHESVA